MAALGGILIIAGILVVRQVAVGRARNLPEDTSAFITALFSGNYGAINETGKKRGDAT